MIRFDPRNQGRRNGVVVIRGFHAGNYARPRSRFDRFAYGVVTGFLIGATLFGLGIVRADEEDAEPVRYQPASRGSRVLERGEVLDRAEVVALAAETFGPGAAGYVANIARCESSYDPNADRNWPYVGLLQVDPNLHYDHVSAVVGYPVGPGDAAWLLRIPRVNLATAARILRAQGWGAWPVCSR